MHQNPITQNLRDAFDDCQAQAHPLAVGCTANIQLIELQENRIEAVFGNATPGVPDFKAQIIAPPPCAQQNVALRGITAGIAEKITHNPRQQAQIGTYCEVPYAHAQVQSCRFGHQLELRGQRRQQLVESIQFDVGLDRGLIQPGNIQQIRQQVFRAFQRLMGPLHQYLLSRRQLPLAQGRDQQPSSIKWLQQIMAGGREVFVFTAIGSLSGVTSFAQCPLDFRPLDDLLLQVAVHVQQLIGARNHALLQLIVELLQVLLGQLAFSDVSNKAFDQAILIRFEQQVHQHIDMATVFALQLGFIAQQATLAQQYVADGLQLRCTARKQVAGKVGQGKQHLLRIVVAQHSR